MANFLNLLLNPQFKYETQFEVLRDFRKGGLNPDNYDDFIKEVRELPPIIQITPNHFTDIIKKFGLIDISEGELIVIQREVRRRSIEKSKICYHPDASEKNCETDSKGRIIISAAHSIQNNGILHQIAEEGHVTGIDFDGPGYGGSKIGKRLASIFWGFCNKHDAMFYPIETQPYSGSEEQHFLFAYRAFTIVRHKKVEASNLIDFGEQANNDLIRTAEMFNSALTSKTYSSVTTDVIELPNHYPIAVASAFYLDFDFNSEPIVHSENRMEFIFVTLLPQEKRTLFLISYFSEDQLLYSKIAKQIAKREKIKSDISILLSPHAENIYFNPTYYRAFIEEQEDQISKAFMEAQLDLAEIGDDNIPTNLKSFTPDNYLQNPYKINLFGY